MTSSAWPGKYFWPDLASGDQIIYHGEVVDPKEIVADELGKVRVLLMMS